jgi:rubrerythrin
MVKIGYHCVTLRNETFSILERLSRTLEKSIPEIIHLAVTDRKVIHGVVFRSEDICLNCGYRPAVKSEKCPICNGTVITRYVKAS